MPDLTEQNIKNLKLLLSAMETDHLSKADFATSFDNVVKFIKKIEDKNIKEFEDLRALIDNLSNKLQQDNGNNFGSLKDEITSTCKEQMDKMMSEHQSKMQAMDDKMMMVQDGKDADNEAILEQLKNEIKIPDVQELKDDLPKMGEQIRDGLELLQGDNRLSASAIQGIEELIPKGSRGSGGGVARGFQLKVDGVKKGLVNMINLIPGSGVSLTYSKAYGRNDITINASSSGLSILTATGAIDGNNATFTFVTSPLLVLVSGVAYSNGHGVTITGLSAVLDTAPDTGQDIYGIG